MTIKTHRKKTQYPRDKKGGWKTFFGGIKKTRKAKGGKPTYRSTQKYRTRKGRK